LIGLAIFLLGSIICASTDNIYYLILGRALQGAGAISGALMALLSDSTKENNRTISMAIVGVAIGAAFFSAFIIGPLLTKYFELSGLFVFIVILTTLSIFLISSFQNTTGKNAQFNFNIVELVLDKTLKPYYVDILVLHTILTSLFIAIPVMMTEIYLISINEFPQLYSSIFILSLVITLPLLGYDRKNPVLVRNISLIILSLSLIFSFQFYNISLFIIMIALIFYIGSFSVLEAGIPSSLSKQTNKETRGLTMSIYTSFQFFGTFLGGFIGGYLYDGYGLSGIFFFTAVISVVWVLICLSRNFIGADIVSK
jgi:MFS family permease